MENKNLIIGAGIAALLALILLGFIFFFSKKSTQPVADSSLEIQEEVVPTIKPTDLGFKLSARGDGKAVKFSIANGKDIDKIEYEITYNAKGDIPRGIIGSMSGTGEDSMESKFFDLGSCSSGKCKYDEGVTAVKFVLKITKKDGKNYQTEESISL